MSLDLYGTSANAIAMGNMRNQQVRDLNERIQQHNTDVANTISGLKDQLKSSERMKKFQEGAQALWTAKGMPDKVKAWNDHFNKPEATNPTTQSERATRQEAEENTTESEAQTEETVDAEAPAEATATAENEAISGAETSAGEVGTEASSTLREGVETAVGKGSKFAGKLGEGAGVLMSAGAGGMDLYEDYEESKKDGHFEIAGNNAWEKAGNILQIGGAISDIAGIAFPPAKLLGGVLDLASAATNEIGQSVDDKSDRALDAQQAQETEKTQALQTETITTGRTQ
jgi:hypothetical protein